MLWSKSEDNKLRRHYAKIKESGITLAEFGKTIGRTESAVSNRGITLGLASPHNAGAVGAANHRWKGEAASDEAMRFRARKLFKLGPCERCGRQGVERHHKDSKPSNNARSNIMIVCRKCHMIVDGRSNAMRKWLRERAKIFIPLKPCSNCKKPYKPLRHGRCHNCRDYFIRTGRERPKSLYLKPSKDKNFLPTACNPRSIRGRSKRACAMAEMEL